MHGTPAGPRRTLDHGSSRRGLLARVAHATVALTVVATVLASGGARADDQVVIRSGETLSHIALRTGVPVSAIVRANGITDPDRVRAGTVLTVPSYSRSGPVSTHVVEAGDTLSEIAARSGTSTQVLVDLNNLGNRHLIRIGQRLTVPVAEGVSSVGTGSYPRLPDRIVQRPERRALIADFERWSAANHIPVDLLMALAWQESGWNNAAVSNKGAAGVGQLMPATASWIARDLIGRPDLDVADPEDNIRMSARYVRWLLDRTGSEDEALAAYYQGVGSIERNEWFDSTRLYVDNVQVHRQYFKSS